MERLREITSQQQGAWCLIGDFNNVLHTGDSVGGAVVHESEYIDLAAVMEVTGLNDMDSIGDHFLNLIDMGEVLSIRE